MADATNTTWPASKDTLPAINANTPEDGAGVEHDVMHDKVHALLNKLQDMIGTVAEEPALSVLARLLALEGALGGPVNALSIAAGVVNIDLAGGTREDFTLALTSNVTSLTFSNLPAAGRRAQIEIQIKQDATGGRTLALPASFKPLGGSDTAIASAANAVTVLSAKTWDQGATWRYAMQESA